MAASALLFALPMSWALMTFANMESAAAPSVALASQSQHNDEDLAMENGPGVTITLEPSAVAYPSVAPSNVPMVMPAGYLVPDDGAGDTAHEGN